MYLNEKQNEFQSSFELTGYITTSNCFLTYFTLTSVSKLFRAYGLYNDKYEVSAVTGFSFQSSFELTGYITAIKDYDLVNASLWFQSSFELTGYITVLILRIQEKCLGMVSKLFRAYGLYNERLSDRVFMNFSGFQSSFELTGYITNTSISYFKSL